MDMGDFSDQAACLQREWGTSPRWAGIQRDYRAEAVIRLRASLTGDHTPARRNACQLWDRLSRADSMRAFGDGTPAVPASPSPDLDPSGQMKTMIAAGAAGVPFEDRLPSPAGAGPPRPGGRLPPGGDSPHPPRPPPTPHRRPAHGRCAQRPYSADRADLRARGVPADVGRGRAGSRVPDR